MKPPVIELMSADSTAVLGRLPEWSDLTTQDVYNGPGSYAFSYPRNALSALLPAQQDYALLRISEGDLADPAVPKPFWGLLDDDGEDEASDAAKGRVIEYSGRGTLAVLEYAVVYPQRHVAGGSVNNLDPRHAFTDYTPGRIMRALISKAQARGALPGVTMTFGNTVDSAGTPWPETYDIVYDGITDYLSVITKMAEDGWADVRMTGLSLSMWVPGGGNADRPTVVFRTGQNVVEQPRANSRRAKRSVVLAVGNDGAAAEAVQAGAGVRREGGVSTDLTHVPTLLKRAQAALAIANTAEGTTVGMLLTDDSPRPRRDYFAGDLIRSDKRRTSATALTPLRAVSVATAYNRSGVAAVSVELGRSGPTDPAVGVQAAVSGLTGGSLVTGKPATPTDLLPPKPPASVAVTSGTYTVPDGTTLARATVTWPDVSENTDDSPYTDHDAYYLSFAVDGGAYSGETRVAGSTCVLDALPPGGSIVVRVRAQDTSGNSSGWTAAGAHLAAVDTTPPQIPSTPAVASLIGAIRVTWDGLGGGVTMPGDFAYVEVHVSTDAAFAPSAATLRDQLVAAGSATITDLPYGVPHYARLVAVDLSHNPSAPSAVASATPRKVGSPDADPALVRNTEHTLFATAAELTGGALAADTAAFDGNGRTAASGQTLGGPAYAALKPGRYRATWFLKSSVNTGTSTVATLTPTSPTAGAVTNLTDTAVPGGRTASFYKAHSVNFTLTQQAVVNLLVAASSASITVSHVTVEPVAAMAVAEIGDAEIGNLSASKITAGVLLADVTLSARIKTADTGRRLEVDAAGLRGYGDGATPNLHYDTATGNVAIIGGTLTGTVYRSAAAGARVQIDSVNAAERIAFFTGNVAEKEPGFITSAVEGVGNPTIRLSTPRFTTALDTEAYLLLRGKASDGGNDASVLGVPGELFLAGNSITLDPLPGRVVIEGSLIFAASAFASRGVLAQWERRRTTVEFSGTATRDTSITFDAPFTAQPVITATSTDSGVILGNFNAQAYNVSATGATVRLRDIDGVARTGTTTFDTWTCL